MYVIDKLTKWEYYLHLVEFSYNNGYQASLKMCPFEVLYGRKCHIPIRWDNPIDWLMLGLYMLKDLEHMANKIKKNLKTTQDGKKVMQT